MSSFLKYPKPVRLPLGKRLPHKAYMDNNGVMRLLSGSVIVEEKMDGTQTYIELDKYILWLEDLKVRHSIKYRIPGRYALFDVYERGTGRFLDYDSKINLWLDIFHRKINVPGNPLIFPVPLVARSTALTLDKIPSLVGLSAYAVDPQTGEKVLMEGVVIKQDRPLYYVEVEHGKFVRTEFLDGIETTYLSRPREFNMIDVSIPIVLGDKESSITLV